MRFRIRRMASEFPRAVRGLFMVALVAGGAAARGQSWPSFGHDAQHTSRMTVASQLPGAVRWSVPVDLDPQYTGGGLLLTHYGSPLISSANNVFIPVKTTATGGFQIDARRGTTGAFLWRYGLDYTLPHHNWIPMFGPSLSIDGARLAMPGAGGTVVVRSNPDGSRGDLVRLAFYDINQYKANPTPFRAAIQICTPITFDSTGNMYYGYVSTGVALPGYPKGIPSGLAKITAAGVGRYASAASLSGDANMKKVSYNCAPAVSTGASTVYVVVNDVPPSSAGTFGSGYLCRLNSSNLARQASVPLKDPRNPGWAAAISDDATASPTLGTDGDVFYGVLEYSFPSNHARGWMLHFDWSLATAKIPGAFGWDDTPSIVPASAVPSYTGGSSYLILTKYNDYAGAGGDGHNKIAVQDPNATETDPVTGATVMQEVITILGPTTDPSFGGTAVYEWCINSVAIDAKSKSAVVNSEDGHVYRWDFTTNSLSPAFPMSDPTGEAYTPTLIAPDGSVYCINNATLFNVVAASGPSSLEFEPAAGGFTGGDGQIGPGRRVEFNFPNKAKR